MEGWTDNYIRVQAPYDEARVNTVQQVTLERENITEEAASE